MHWYYIGFILITVAFAISSVNIYNRIKTKNASKQPKHIHNWNKWEEYRVDIINDWGDWGRFRNFQDRQKRSCNSCGLVQDIYLSGQRD